MNNSLNSELAWCFGNSGGWTTIQAPKDTFNTEITTLSADSQIELTIYASDIHSAPEYKCKLLLRHHRYNMNYIKSFYVADFPSLFLVLRDAAQLIGGKHNIPIESLPTI